MGADEKVVGDLGTEIRFFDEVVASSKSIFVDDVWEYC